MAEKPAESLPKVRAGIRRDRKLIETADARMREGIKRAIELGAGAPDLAEDSGLTVTRIGQIVGGVRRVRAAAGIPNPKRKRTGPIPSQAPAAEEPGTPA